MNPGHREESRSAQSVAETEGAHAASAETSSHASLGTEPSVGSAASAPDPATAWRKWPLLAGPVALGLLGLVGVRALVAHRAAAARAERLQAAGTWVTVGALASAGIAWTVRSSESEGTATDEEEPPLFV